MTKEEFISNLLLQLLQPYDDDFIIYKSSSGNKTKKDILSSEKEKVEYFNTLMNVSRDILKSKANKQSKNEKDIHN